MLYISYLRIMDIDRVNMALATIAPKIGSCF